MAAELVIGYLAAWVWVVLPALYWYTAPEWWRSRTGRALMWLLGSTAALFFLLLTGRAFGEYPGKPLVQAFVFALTLGAGIRLAVLFFQLRNDLNKRLKVEPRDGLVRDFFRRMKGRTVK